VGPGGRVPLLISGAAALLLAMALAAGSAGPALSRRIAWESFRRSRSAGSERPFADPARRASLDLKEPEK